MLNDGMQCIPCSYTLYRYAGTAQARHVRIGNGCISHEGAALRIATPRSYTTH